MRRLSKSDILFIVLIDVAVFASIGIVYHQHSRKTNLLAEYKKTKAEYKTLSKRRASLLKKYKGPKDTLVADPAKHHEHEGEHGEDH